MQTEEVRKCFFPAVSALLSICITCVRNAAVCVVLAATERGPRGRSQARGGAMERVRWRPRRS